MIVLFLRNEGQMICMSDGPSSEENSRMERQCDVPCYFFLVSIVQEGQHWVLQPREDAGITFNKSFLLAFSFYNKVKLEEDLLDTNFEDFEKDSTVFRTQLYQQFEGKIEINFNPENFRDELTPFQDFKKEAFESKHRNGEIKLFPEAVLGIFPQAGSQLVPDYLQLIDNDSFQDLETFFQRKNTNGDDNSPGPVHATTIPSKKRRSLLLLNLTRIRKMQ